MINVSNAWKSKVLAGDCKYRTRGTITLANGEVVEFDDERIAWGGVEISEGTSGNGSFDIGAAVATSLNLRIRNSDDAYSEYDFEGARVAVQIGLVLGSSTEWIARGVYTVEAAAVTDATINLSCLDNMAKLDKPYCDVATNFPATLGEIVRDICLAETITLATPEFDHYDYTINARPDDEDLTERQMLAYVAQIAGCYAKFDENGALELKWYDTEVFDNVRQIDGGIMPILPADSIDGGAFPDPPENSLDTGTFDQMEERHHIYALASMSVGTDDVVITGIKCTDIDGEEFQYGTDGYVLSLEDNPLIEAGMAEAVATHLGEKIVGMHFRPLNVSAISDPAIEAGDAAYVTDRKGNSYPCYLTNISYTIGGYETFTCDAKTPARNRAAEYSSSTKAIVAARKEAQKVVSAYDKQVEEMTALISNGFGMYMSRVEQEDGSVVTYMHDKPTIEESSYTCYHTANGIMASLDGGTTWAVDRNGNALFNVIVARGLQADWVTAGTLQGVEILTLAQNGGGFIITAGQIRAVFPDGSTKAVLTAAQDGTNDVVAQVDVLNGYKGYTGDLYVKGYSSDSIRLWISDGRIITTTSQQ